MTFCTKMWKTGMKICFKRNVYHFKWIKINKLFVPWHDYFREITVIIYFSSRISTVVLATTELGLGTILQRQMCTNHTHLQFMLQTYSCTLLNSVKWLNIYVHLRMHKIIKWHTCTIMVHAVKKKTIFLKEILAVQNMSAEVTASDTKS